MTNLYASDVDGAKALVEKYEALRQETAKVIVGQNDIIHDTILSIFCQGHVLLVGVPGLAKTLLVNTIGKALGLTFSRIQFTPDLMPSDIVGTEILTERPIGAQHFRTAVLIMYALHHLYVLL